MKEQLVQLVNAYAAARSSGDALLQQFAGQQLQTFLETVEVVQKTVEPEPVNCSIKPVDPEVVKE